MFADCVKTRNSFFLIMSQIWGYQNFNFLIGRQQVWQWQWLLLPNQPNVQTSFPSSNMSLFIYRRPAIISRSWLQAILEYKPYIRREFSKKNLLKNKEMVFENGAKNIQAEAYNGAYGTSIFEILYFLKWCPICDNSPLHQFTKYNNFLFDVD